MKHLFVLIFALMSAFTAQAQDVGFIAGIGNTSASIDGSDINAEIGYRLGVAVKMELVDRVAFRTGGMYTTRPFNIENTTAGTDLDIKFAYFDIPAIFQFSFNDRVAVFAGPVVALNAGKKGKGTFANQNIDGNIDDVKSIYLLAQVGVNFDFDGIGFDLYYERGLGDIVKNGAKDYSVMGANFVYWF